MLVYDMMVLQFDVLYMETTRYQVCDMGCWWYGVMIRFDILNGKTLYVIWYVGGMVY